MRRYMIEILVLAGFFLVGTIAINMHEGKPAFMRTGHLDLQAAITYWRERIREVGPRAAHDEMVAAGKGFAGQHNLSHTFGEALFDEGGLPYIKYCGAGEYLYGCYHQFMGLAALHYGDSILSQLKGACDSAAGEGECTHGIGHGLLSARDYSSASVAAALGNCTSIYETRDDQGNCADGVFMEYNLQEMTSFYAGDVNPIPRPFDRSNAYSICSNAGVYRNECIYELPLWWWFSMPTSTAETDEMRSQQTSVLCDGFKSAEDHRICELGIGFPSSQKVNFSIDAIKTICEGVPAGNDRIYCLSGAARRFYENHVLKSTTCADLGLTGAGLNYCSAVVGSSRLQMFVLKLQ